MNTFRLVLGHYFGAELDLVADKSAWCTWWRPYVFMPFDEASYTMTLEAIRSKRQPRAPLVQKRETDR